MRMVAISVNAVAMRPITTLRRKTKLRHSHSTTAEAKSSSVTQYDGFTTKATVIYGMVLLSARVDVLARRRHASDRLGHRSFWVPPLWHHHGVSGTETARDRLSHRAALVGRIVAVTSTYHKAIPQIWRAIGAIAQMPTGGDSSYDTIPQHNHPSWEGGTRNDRCHISQGGQNHQGQCCPLAHADDWSRNSTKVYFVGALDFRRLAQLLGNRVQPPRSPVHLTRSM